MGSSAIAAAAVVLLLLEAVQRGREILPPGSLQEFDAETAGRLLAKGAAVVPPAPPALPAREQVIEKTVKALSDAGLQFQKLKATEKAVAFVAAQTDLADVAELQALEFRREGGPRAELVDAFGAAFARLSTPPAE